MSELEQNIPLPDRCPGCFQEKKGSVCDHCGFDDDKQQPSMAIEPKTMIHEHLCVGVVLSQNDLQFNYLGWDDQKKVKVIIQEFFPRLHARRGPDMLQVRSTIDESKEIFEDGREAFLYQERTLSAINHTGLPSILACFQANNTAYAVVEYRDKAHLGDVINYKLMALSESLFLPMVVQLLAGLEMAHAKEVYHLNIAPQNIGVQGKLGLHLTNFMGYHDQLGEHSQSIPINPGYSAPELYFPEKKLGPYTDVFNICAAIYRALTGRWAYPVEFDPRTDDRPLLSLDGVSGELGQILTNGLSLDVNSRIQSIGLLRQKIQDIIEEEEMPPIRKPTQQTAVALPVEEEDIKPRMKLRLLSLGVVLLGTTGLLLFGAPIWLTVSFLSLFLGVFVMLSYLYRGGSKAMLFQSDEESIELKSLLQSNRKKPMTKAEFAAQLEPLFQAALSSGRLGEAIKIINLLKQQQIDIQGHLKEIEKRFQPGHRYECKPIKMEMGFIPSGIFIMGSNDGAKDERPKTRVVINEPFFMSVHPVTQRQWFSLMGTKPWRGRPEVLEHPDAPATYVSWQDARDFINKLNSLTGRSPYRLPTEAQWEYAARAGKTNVDYFGADHNKLKDFAWFRGSTKGGPHPRKVMRKKGNDWKLHDCVGNVWEWCHNGYFPYTGGEVNNPGFHEPATIEVVCRGGSWKDSSWRCGLTTRATGDLNDRNSSHGFRILRTVE